MIVYKITNTLNNKVYIGITERSLDTRWKEHMRKCKRGDKTHLYDAMRKIGIENFSISIIEDNIKSYDELLLREQFYVSKYNSYSDGYNMTAGGDSNPMKFSKSKERHDNIMRDEKTRNKISNTMKEKISKGEFFSKEHRKKLSESSKGRVYVHKDGIYTSIKPNELSDYLADGWEKGGKPLSDEQRANLIKVHTGMKFSEESKKKMSESHRGKSPSNKGVPRSDETKKKLSECFIGRRWVNNGKVQKQIKEEEIEKYLESGYSFGRLTRKVVMLENENTKNKN